MLDAERSLGTQVESAGEQGLRRLIANVAHDLKTPLSALTNGNELVIGILSELKLALLHIPEVPDSIIGDIEFAETTLESTQSMSQFMRMSINRCMEFSQIQEDCKLKPMSGTVHLAEAVQLPINCIESVEPSQIIDVFPPPSNVCTHVITDAQWLQENILCLLSNAVKYSNHEKIALRLSVQPCVELYEEYNLSPCAVGSPLSPRAVPEMVVVECEDSGIGLSGEAMANLFAPFKQAQRLAGGTGLGLYSLANRMAALHGHCGVRPRRDGTQGCRFWFAFPYKPDEMAAEAALESDSSCETAAKNVSLRGRQNRQLRMSFKKVLPVVLPFEGAEECDNGSIAPLPVFAKKLSSRSLITALSHLPNTTESVTPISRWRRSSPAEAAEDALTNTMSLSGKTQQYDSQAPSANTSCKQEPYVGIAGGPNVAAPAQPVREASVLPASPLVPAMPLRSSPRAPDSHRKLVPSGTSAVAALSGSALRTSSGCGGVTPRPSSARESPPNSSRTVATENESPLYTPRYSTDTPRRQPIGEVRSILLVDDTPLILRITSGLLHRAGYEVTTANNGHEAMHALQLRSFDMVLMDLQMPVLDGLETVRRIRVAEAKTPHCPDGEPKRRQFMVAVSANSDSSIIQDALSTGFDAYIEKPFDMHQFDRAVEAYSSHTQVSTTKHTTSRSSLVL